MGVRLERVMKILDRFRVLAQPRENNADAGECFGALRRQSQLSAICVERAAQITLPLQFVALPLQVDGDN